mgnify:FL=1
MRSARKPALYIRVSVTFVGLAAIATPVAKTAAEKSTIFLITYMYFMNLVANLIYLLSFCKYFST